MPFHRLGIEAHRRALQRSVLEGIRRQHDDPGHAQFGALEVIGEEQILLLGDRLHCNRGKLRRIGDELSWRWRTDGFSRLISQGKQRTSVIERQSGRWLLNFEP